ncbi:MAG TPA: bifunctional glutamate N-acetyltransferase/amino-acid acetyltransferase ArgJ [Opitutales bacterium]|nr:bifunctional glutamate N-acetyltransferase/amino-acid acetyltransferase ArgJ [Opitutales bacterium]
MSTDSNYTFAEGTPGITEVPGFTAAGYSCDIRCKGNDRLDTALVFSALPCAAAGTFTTNDVKAAPVRLDMARIAKGGAFHAVIANSGNANAYTGEQGKKDAAEMAALTAQALGIPEESVLVGSTGRIGRDMPMERFRKGIPLAAKLLSSDKKSGEAAAWAILTSDTRPKTATASFECKGKKIVVSGMAKGAGMIQPNMATMLAFIATNAALPAATLQTILRRSVFVSFNRITVDGDMSTNDTAIILANGESGLSEKELGTAGMALFERAVHDVCKALAAMMVGDGEKITKVVTVNITGAKTEADAEKIARCIGNSLLVKSSWFGDDPNWGRIMDAAGYARVGLDETAFDLSYDDIPVVRQGTPLHDNLPQWKECVSKKHFAVNLDVHAGNASFTLLASDLTEGYVNYNKSE